MAQEKTIKFAEIKDQILAALETRSQKKSFGIEEKATLVEGFLNEPFSKELTNSIVIGGPTVPMIMLVGNESGKIYFFALKALVPGVWE
jgi:hypothetical protein